MKTNTDYKDVEKMKHYPFWRFDDKGKVKISISTLRKFLDDNGFYRRQVGDDILIEKALVQENEGILTRHHDQNVKDWLTKLIEENEGSDDDQDKIEKLDEILEGWLGYKTKDVDDNLRPYTSKQKPVFRDTKDTCYIPFRNGIVEITQNSIALKPYEELAGEGCVWASSIRKHNIDISDIPKLSPDLDIPVVAQLSVHFGDEFVNSPYIRFVISSFKRGVEPIIGEDIWKGIAPDEKKKKEWVDSMKGYETSMGYLIHQYIDQSHCPAVILVDGESMTSGIAEGGTGKSISLKELKWVRNVATIDAQKLSNPNYKRFMFSHITEETDLVLLEDVPDNFTQSDFFNAITGDFEAEGKGTNKIILDADMKPKLAMTSNYVIPARGSSERRRQHIVHFGDYLKKVSDSDTMTAKEIFGKELCRESTFSKEDWNNYYLYHIFCVQRYLMKGLLKSKNLLYKSLVLKERVGNPDVLEWVENWVDGERITSGCDKNGIAISKIYKSFSDHFVGETFMAEWDEKRFGDKLFDYVMARDDLEWNPDQASRGDTRRKRLWQKGPAGNQEPWVKVVNKTT